MRNKAMRSVDKSGAFRLSLPAGGRWQSTSPASSLSCPLAVNDTSSTTTSIDRYQHQLQLQHSDAQNTHPAQLHLQSTPLQHTQLFSNSESNSGMNARHGHLRTSLTSSAATPDNLQYGSQIQQYNHASPSNVCSFIHTAGPAAQLRPENSTAKETQYQSAGCSDHSLPTLPSTVEARQSKVTSASSSGTPCGPLCSPSPITVASAVAQHGLSPPQAQAIFTLSGAQAQQAEDRSTGGAFPSQVHSRVGPRKRLACYGAESTESEGQVDRNGVYNEVEAGKPPAKGIEWQNSQQYISQQPPTALGSTGANSYSTFVSSQEFTHQNSSKQALHQEHNHGSDSRPLVNPETDSSQPRSRKRALSTTAFVPSQKRSTLNNMESQDVYLEPSFDPAYYRQAFGLSPTPQQPGDGSGETVTLTSMPSMSSALTPLPVYWPVNNRIASPNFSGFGLGSMNPPTMADFHSQSGGGSHSGYNPGYTMAQTNRAQDMATINTLFGASVQDKSNATHCESQHTGTSSMPRVLPADLCLTDPTVIQWDNIALQEQQRGHQEGDGQFPIAFGGINSHQSAYNTGMVSNAAFSSLVFPTTFNASSAMQSAIASGNLDDALLASGHVFQNPQSHSQLSLQNHGASNSANSYSNASWMVNVENPEPATVAPLQTRLVPTPSIVSLSSSASSGCPSTRVGAGTTAGPKVSNGSPATESVVSNTVGGSCTGKRISIPNSHMMTTLPGNTHRAPVRAPGKVSSRYNRATPQVGPTNRPCTSSSHQSATTVASGPSCGREFSFSSRHNDSSASLSSSPSSPLSLSVEINSNISQCATSFNILGASKQENHASTTKPARTPLPSSAARPLTTVTDTMFPAQHGLSAINNELGFSNPSQHPSHPMPDFMESTYQHDNSGIFGVEGHHPYSTQSQTMQWATAAPSLTSPPIMTTTMNPMLSTIHHQAHQSHLQDTQHQRLGSAPEVDYAALERQRKDAFLVAQKQAGMAYKDIKVLGQFTEAESTLRGRYRTLTKHKRDRVRKPEWGRIDLRLLCEAVDRLRSDKPLSTSANSKAATTPRSRSKTHSNLEVGEELDGPRTRRHTTTAVPTHDTRTRRSGSGSSIATNDRESSDEPKVSWKAVAEYITNHGGSYKFGYATCRKKWNQITSIGKRHECDARARQHNDISGTGDHASRAELLTFSRGNMKQEPPHSSI